MAFCDGANDAAFWGTIYQSLPWQWSPAYSNLVAFHVSMIFPDLLHVWNLGVARDLVGSAVRVFMDHGVWGPGAEAVMLAAATTSLKTFCRLHQLPLKLQKLTKSKLKMSKSRYPELCSSGYDSYVVLLWLLDEATKCPTLPNVLRTCLWAGNHAVSGMCNAGHFLTSLEQNNVREIGLLFVRCYLRLAREALDDGRKLFRVRPKFHMLHHCFRSVFSETSRTNHGAYSTWMDEDALKKLMKVMKLTDKRTVDRRLMQRWLMQLPQTWREARKTIKSLRARLCELLRPVSIARSTCSGPARYRSSDLFCLLQIN